MTDIRTPNFHFENAYLVVFADYSKTNPVYSELKLSHILVSRQTETTMESLIFYEQAQISFKFNISLEESSVKFTLYTDSNPDNESYRFGVVIVDVPNNPLLAGEEIEPTENTSSVVNYHKTWDRKWPTESYINFPCVSFKSDQYCSMFCPIDYNSQFFFCDGKLRITTLITLSKTFEMILSDHRDSIKEHYLTWHPHADKQINFWKIQINKVFVKHRVHITYSTNGTHNESIRFNPVASYLIDQSVTTISEEIEKYPITLSSIGLKEIILCENIRKHGHAVNGFLLRQSNMFLECSSNVMLARTFHHEIFHLFQSKIDLKVHSIAWSNANEVPEITNKDCDNLFTEESCKLYGLMMTDGLLVQNLSSSNPDLQNRINIVETIYFEVCKTQLKWKTKSVSLRPKRHDPDASSIDGQSIGINRQLITQKPAQENRHSANLLCGYPGSGIKLTMSYLSQQNIKSSTDLNTIDQNNLLVYYFKSVDETKRILDRLKCNVICLIRDPSFYAHKMGDVFLDDWLEMYSCFFDRPNTLMIKYEDLAINDISVIKKICEFIGQQSVDIKSLIDIDKIAPKTDFLCDSFYRRHTDNVLLSGLQYRS